MTELNDNFWQENIRLIDILDETVIEIFQRKKKFSEDIYIRKTDNKVIQVEG